MLVGKTISQAPDPMCWSLRFKGIAHDRSSGYRARHCRNGNTSNDHGGSAWLKVGTLLVGDNCPCRNDLERARYRRVVFAMTGACGTRRRGDRENAPLIWQWERWKDDQRLYQPTAPQSSSASRFTARASDSSS